MALRLDSMVTPDTQGVRVLVPRWGADGEIEYHISTARVRLPLERADRETFYRRLWSYHVDSDACDR